MRLKKTQRQLPPEIFKAYDYSKYNWSSCAINSVSANKSNKPLFLLSAPFRLQETKQTDCLAVMVIQKKTQEIA